MLTKLMRFACLWTSRTRPTRQYSINVYVPTDSERSRLTMRGFANQRNPYDDLIIQNESAEERERILGQYFSVFKAAIFSSLAKNSVSYLAPI